MVEEEEEDGWRGKKKSDAQVKWKTANTEYLSCIMVNTKAQINPLWSPEAFNPEIIFKFF